MSEQYAKQTAHEPGLLRAGRADGTDSALPAEALRRPQAPLRPSEAAATVPAYSPLSADAAALSADAAALRTLRPRRPRRPAGLRGEPIQPVRARDGAAVHRRMRESDRLRKAMIPREVPPGTSLFR